MLERLMGATGWLTGEALAAGLSASPLATEDALADLVTDGEAEYKFGAGYRLSGTVLCRQALRTLLAGGGKRAIAGQEFKGIYRVGVAERRGDCGLVMYELGLPMPPPGPEQLARHREQINAILKFTTKGEAA